MVSQKSEFLNFFRYYDLFTISGPSKQFWPPVPCWVPWAILDQTSVYRQWHANSACRRARYIKEEVSTRDKKISLLQLIKNTKSKICWALGNQLIRDLTKHHADHHHVVGREDNNFGTILVERWWHWVEFECCIFSSEIAGDERKVSTIVVKGRSREGGPMHPNALADAVKGRPA